MNKGLYIHIPFCLSKCPYCDFYSVAFDSDTANRYKDAVIRNLRYYLSQDENLRFDTVYFGGGTPILLWREICDIMDEIQPYIASGAEITVEANPCCTDENALCSLKAHNVNDKLYDFPAAKSHFGLYAENRAGYAVCKKRAYPSR